MKHPLDHIIEQQILEAQEKGQFDHLSGAGKPLPDQKPEEADLVQRIVKEQGGKPAYVLLNGKLQALINRMAETKDPLAKRAIKQKIADLRTSMAIEKERG